VTRSLAIALALGLAACTSPAADNRSQANAVQAVETTGGNLATPAPPAIATASDAIAKGGAAAFLKANGPESSVATSLLAAAESGNGPALALLGTLRPVADAGWAEALDGAAARALPKATSDVLALTAKGFKVESLCTSPFIEPEGSVEADYNKAALAAVTAFAAPAAMASTRTACLTALQGIAKDIAASR
jgi:hypothetical protein